VHQFGEKSLIIIKMHGMYVKIFEAQRARLCNSYKKTLNSVQAGSQVIWPTTHSITQSDSDQCHTHTLTRVSPTNFDTILFFWFLI